MSDFFKRNGHKICYITGVTSFLLSSVSGVKATVNATKAIKLKEEELKRKLNKKEIFKLCWKYYIPTVTFAAGGTALILTANKIVNGKIAAISNVAAVANTTLQAYQEQAVKMLGEKKAQDIHEKVSEELVNNNPPIDKNIISTGNGDKLFYEPLSDRYFYSDWNKIKESAFNLNKKAQFGMENYIILNDWFTALGLNRIDLGDHYAWKVFDGKYIDITIDSVVPKDANYPVGSIFYFNQPSIFD